ncbi:MAG: site-specific integrase [Chthoniobacter sp.]|nr:site-specific integrase [Chthoniobacter sp.]
MASYYTRTGSPYYWLRTQNPDGTWGGKSSGIRIDSPGAIRKIKQREAEETLREQQLDSTGGAHRFDQWVPGFLKQRYANPKTFTRYMNAWSALSTYLDFKKIISPAQVTYQLCIDYPKFRTNAPRELMRSRAWNTALTELKIFSAIMQEAVRRDFIKANPAARLGLKRTPPKEKAEITPEEAAKIEEALKNQDDWMLDSWLVAMRQGSRISETAVPLANIDVGNMTLWYAIKGGKTHTAPLHPDLLPLVERAMKAKRKTLADLPPYAPKKWHQFFRRIGLPHLSFHCTRVTVITKLARSGVPISQAMAYVGHASNTVHRIYQRLMPADVAHLGAVLSNPTAGTQDAPAATPKPNRQSKRRRASENLPTSSV